jgi:hypothetical protein
MNFNNGKHFEAPRKDVVSGDVETEKKLTEEEILNSDNVEIIVKYAKEHRSQAAINKTRELLESAREIGENVVQNFLNSFKECERDKISYSGFEDTESGKIALSLLEKIPEPFKANAYKKLADYKEELAYNTELFEKHKNHPEAIWKEVFGFDYYNIPDFKERFKTFLFRDMGAISEKYYKKNGLEVVDDPFAINFFVEDPENFNKAYNAEIKNADDIFGGFSKKQGKTTINIINTGESSPNDNFRRDKSEIIAHETEHAIHRKTNTINAVILEADVLEPWMDFDYSKHRLNYAIKFDFQERLKKAKDELFAYFKGGTEKEEVSSLLCDKGANSSYDYNKETRDLNKESINNNQHYAEEEKQKLKDAIDFLQSEYERVLNNMIDLTYEKNQSVEFFRNVPINELWKYSNGKYNRTDFIIRDFKFYEIN